ncbi:phosphodiesterase [Thermomonospora catenispora]|uniref:phosphodiesterase n=1 Tax=Thermomonospora catenispora TaxID=2493090 RepID=UPI00111C9FC6|nr:phosphodiesterase [Thermomonospora catenispora]TNY36887.1 phosphodiesterase [Thermomonospora catenispora]
MIAEILSVPFQVAARLRHDRALHPHGRDYRATLHLIGTMNTPLEAGDHEIAVRISKSVSTPGGLPDILGVAFRVPAAAGAVDLLFATTGTGPVTRHLLRVRRSFTVPYTTLLPYEVGGDLRVLGLLPAPGRRVPCDLAVLDAAIRTEPLTFELATASPAGRWRPWGTLRIHTPLPGGSPEAGAFDPQLNRLPGLRPAGPFQRFRRLSYARSRRGAGRPAPGRRAAARR